MRPITLAFIAALVAAPAAAQVEVQPLAAPDLFSLGSRDAGLDDLWRGSSPEVARAVIPRVGTRPLSPAAAALARRVLGAGAVGPTGAGDDPELAAARVEALLALGAPRAAWAAVERAPNLATSAALSQAAAETALIVGEDETACRVADQLGSRRGDLYWLRLRAYCQARAGQTDAAQLTLTLASEKQRDPVVSRLIGAVIAGVGDPGAASLRNGLEYALSRRLALDLTPARQGAAPAVLGLLEGPPAAPDPGPEARRFAAEAGRAAELDVLFGQVQAGDAKARARHEAAVLLAVALGAQPQPQHRALMAGFTVPPGAISPARLAVIDLAAAQGLKGETALLVLAAAGEAGGKPLKPADSARIVAALDRVGLHDEAVAFAGEAFAALPGQ